jgi:predicted RecA/RadA family phage recombinase
MKNQVYTGTPTSRRFALCPTTVVAGDAVLLGKMPAVALDSYNAQVLGTTFLLGGSFNLTVIGQTVASPQTAAAIKPGDKIYAVGSLDSATNVTTGLTLDAASGGTLFGSLDPSYTAGVSSGATDTAAIVKLAGEE